MLKAELAAENKASNCFPGCLEEPPFASAPSYYNCVLKDTHVVITHALEQQRLTSLAEADASAVALQGLNEKVVLEDRSPEFPPQHYCPLAWVS